MDVRRQQRRRAVALCAGALLAAAAARADGPARPGSASPAGADGKALYAQHCTRCHGATGRAAPAYARQGTPDLNDPAWQKSKTDAQVRDAIAKGSPGSAMTAFRNKLGAAEIDALVRHVRTLAKKRP